MKTPPGDPIPLFPSALVAPSPQPPFFVSSSPLPSLPMATINLDGLVPKIEGHVVESTAGHNGFFSMLSHETHPSEIKNFACVKGGVTTILTAWSRANAAGYMGLASFFAYLIRKGVQ